MADDRSTLGGPLIEDLSMLGPEYDKYKAAGGSLGFWGFYWKVITGGNPWDEFGGKATTEAESIVAGVPGLKEALDVYQQSGDYTGVMAAMDAYRASSEDTATETSGAAPASFDVVNVNGLLFSINKDADGNYIPMSELFIMEAPSATMTQFQTAQVENWVEQNTFARDQLDFQMSQWAAQTDIDEETLDFEKRRWAEQYLLSMEQLAQSKYQFQQELGWKQADTLLSQYQFEKTLALQNKQLKQQQKQFELQLGFDKEQAKAMMKLQRDAMYAEMTANPRRWIEAYQFKEETLPPAPGWLGEFARGQTAMGITPAPTKTPSAEAYQKMPWGQREMLGGFAEFSNVPGSPQNITEIEQKIGSMLPKQKEQTARWQPARQ